MNFVTMFIHDNKLKFGGGGSGRDVSAFGGRDGRGRGRGRGRGGRSGRGGRGNEKYKNGTVNAIEDRYYSYKEYVTFTKEQKEKLRELKQLRSDKGDDRPRKVQVVEANNEVFTFEIDVPKVVAAAQSSPVTSPIKSVIQASDGAHYMRVKRKPPP